MSNNWIETVEELKSMSVKSYTLADAARQIGISVPTLTKALKGKKVSFFAELKITHFLKERSKWLKDLEMNTSVHQTLQQ